MAPVLFLGREGHTNATSNLGDLGDAAETGRNCATGVPHCHRLASLLCVPSRGHEWGDRAAARPATLKIWQASCIAGALTSLAAIGQIAVPRPSIATPNARVADAFSGVPLNVMTVLTNAGAAFPDPAIETKFDLSAHAIVAAGFSAAAPDSVPPSDVTTSQGPRLQVASLEAASPENSATLQQDG